MTEPLLLDGETLSLDGLARLLCAEPGTARCYLTNAAWEQVDESRRRLDHLDPARGPYYGINTGFGKLCDVLVPQGQLEALQHNLIVSHAVGVGPRVPDDVVRVMLAVKVNSLSRGHSGVRRRTLEMLLAFLQQDLLPHIPAQGSCGASGDLAPLAHLSLALLGRGTVSLRGVEMPAAEALAKCGLSPLTLGAKEGLALINGTQYITGYGTLALLRARNLAATADIAAAMSLEAMRGSMAPFDERLHAARPHAGARHTARNIRELLDGSTLREGAAGAVQDPYSLRCVPAVHGASRDAFAHATAVLELEINASTDNPLLMANGDVLSGGNFHGQPMALPMDYAGIALAELASISERRTYLLLEGRGGLPKLLLKETGLNSGYMIAQYTQASLVSENKVLGHPASIDSIPTSLGQEDHVSMGSIAARKALQIAENAEAVLAIELLCAAQALDFAGPENAGRAVKAAHRTIRAAIAHADCDREFGIDIQTALRLVRSGVIVQSVREVLHDFA